MIVEIPEAQATLNKANFLRGDRIFDKMYPPAIGALSAIHWTPLDVVEEASDFLAAPGARILDVGAGAGKFCIAAGSLHPEATFYGIEHRKPFVDEAERVRLLTGINNVNFRCGNITDLKSDDFDHFYFYNSFCEQVQPWGRIDNTVKISFSLYQRYKNHFHAMLEKKPADTRLVTYHTPNSELPKSYKLVRNSYKKCLKLWIKT